MSSAKSEYSLAELKERMDDYGIGSVLQDWLYRSSEFHTYSAPGLLIGVFMIDYAMELLGADPREKLYTVCETHKCAPDAVQVVAHCTFGNNRLRIIPTGRFALTLNRSSAEETTEAVRVYIDPKKLERFPIIFTWFTKSPDFDKKTMARQLTDQILGARREILSWERVRVPVRRKKEWKSATCPVCGEHVPEHLLEEWVCASCGSLHYYEKAT
ncbi:FmdE family protein [Methanoregula sp.]|uniref:FmdE family protein n=1 Tax=Methanoregula sp. TaxID=2052170 RepID=UPI0025CDC0EB|nr:FmdE family protein [Methanoregula sp.]